VRLCALDQFDEGLSEVSAIDRGELLATVQRQIADLRAVTKSERWMGINISSSTSSSVTEVTETRKAASNIIEMPDLKFVRFGCFFCDDRYDAGHSIFSTLCSPLPDAYPVAPPI
jgi:hypothetical protein